MNVVITLDDEAGRVVAQVMAAIGIKALSTVQDVTEYVDFMHQPAPEAGSVASFYVKSLPVLESWLREISLSTLIKQLRVVVISSQTLMAKLADPASGNEARLVDRLNRLCDAGIEFTWAIIKGDDAYQTIVTTLEETGAPQPAIPPVRLPSFGWCNRPRLAKAISTCLPLFHTKYRAAEMCASDCMIDGEIFAAEASEPGFRSHLWGPFAHRSPVARRGRGILYIAFGKKYVDIAEHAALSLKKYNANLPIALVTDTTEVSSIFDYVIRPSGAEVIIDRYFRPTSRMESMKFIAFPFSPFEETLFLDCDTVVRGSISEIFDLFPTEDIVLTNESKVATDGNGHPLQRTAELTDPKTYNAGVFLFRSTAAAERYLTAWWAWFIWDQAGPRRYAGNWGGSGVADQSVLHLMVWSAMHKKLQVELGFAPNTVFNATDRIWAKLHDLGRWEEAKILHSKLPFQVRGTAKENQLWTLEWPRSWR